MMRTGKAGEMPDLNAALAECRLTITKLSSPLKAKERPETTHAWSVLVPREWPKVEGQGNRPLVDSGSGRHWYDGYGISESDARRKACKVLGQVLGGYLYKWMGEQEPPRPETLQALTSLGGR